MVQKWLRCTLIISLMCVTHTYAHNLNPEHLEADGVTIVAPSDAGSVWDRTARSIKSVLKKIHLTDKRVQVENRPGGSGSSFLKEYVTHDEGNNNKLFVNSPTILINNLKPGEYRSTYGYRDVTPLVGLTEGYVAIVVKADSQFKTFKSLVRAVDKDSDNYRFSGGSSRMAMDHLLLMQPFYKSGVNIRKIDYEPSDGSGQALVKLLDEDVDAVIADVDAIGEFTKLGKIRVLAVSAPTRIKGLNAPTYKELGIDAEFRIWKGVFGPKKMSEPMRFYWSTVLAKMANSSAWKDELRVQGWNAYYRDGLELEKLLVKQEAELKELIDVLNVAE